MRRVLIGVTVLAIAIGVTLALRARASRGAREGGWVSERIAACGKRPNCVSSRETRADFRVEPLNFTGSPEEAFERARAAVEALPRTRIVVSEAGYIRAECSSAVFGFVDDLELELEVDSITGRGTIQLRSASRQGYSDLGVNRKRVEHLRAALR